MGHVLVLRSTKLGKWGSDVGLGKHLFAVVYTEAVPESCVAEMNARPLAGESDWTVLGRKDVGERKVSEDELVERVARKEKWIDPTYYPRLKGARAVFKVRPESVQNFRLLQNVMAGEPDREIKVKPADFGDYLLKLAAN